MKTTLIIAILISLSTLKVMASESQEKIYLTQIVNQLDAIRPLIIAANQEQEKYEKYTRTKFHYLSYRDVSGVRHNGLLEDVNAIKKGIQAKLNQTVSEPRHFQKINGDYINFKNKPSSISNTEGIANAK
jgi:RAQPRD family integrative conjugative element protein